MIILGKDIDKINENENVIVQGVLIMKKDFGKYVDLVIDDFTSILTIRTFDIDVSNFEEGDFVTIYGYIKEYNGNKKIYAKKILKSKETDIFYWKMKLFKEKDILIDPLESKLIKRTEPEKNDNEEFHKELRSENIEDKLEDENLENDELDIEIEKPFDFDPKEYILNIIKSSPNKEISLEELYKKADKLSKEEIDKILEDLIDEIFEPKPGVIKLIEL